MSRQMNDALWRQLSEQITTGMCEWRDQHPKATLREMETELDTRWAHVRARMLQDMAHLSDAAAWADSPRLQHPTCPECGERLQERGQQPRTLLTHGGQDLTLTRSYGVCPACGAGLFPPG
jgi:YgiT-type zinc finger domain-containing protein